jgi:hypothetical protein
MSDWDWKCVDTGWAFTRTWIARNGHHVVKAVLLNPNIYEGDNNTFKYLVLEDDVTIIDHNNGRTMTFGSLAEVRRFFGYQGEVQDRLQVIHDEMVEQRLHDERVADGLAELKKYTDEGRRMFAILTAPGSAVNSLAHARRDGWRGPAAHKVDEHV